MKWLKRILATAGILVLLFVVVAILFVATFDPNDYKRNIESAVEQATSRELALQGDIDLSFFPWLGMKLGPARLGNAEGFGDEPFASVENVQVRVALLPLFRGEVRADTVTLEGMRANLRINEQGESNWEDLIKTEEEAPPATEKPARELALAVGGIEIENAAVHWQDAQSGTDVKLAPINLSTGALAFGEPFDLDLDLRLINAEPAVEADIKLAGKATVNPEAQHYRLADVQLTVNATGEGLPEDGVEMTLDTAIDADLAAGTAAVQPLTLEFANLRLEGQMSAAHLNSEPQVQATLKSDAFSPRQLLAALGQALPLTSDPNVLENATLKLVFNATPKSAKLSQFEAQVDDTHFTGQGAVQSFDDPKIDFAVALDAMDLDRYMPPKTETEPEAQPAPSGEPAPPANDNLGLPIDLLRDLHLDGRLTAGRLKASDLTFTDLQATITARDGLIKVTPLGLKLYEGSLKGNAALDVRGATPRFAINSVLEGVQAGEVVKQMFGDDYLTGISRLTLDLKTQGDRVSALKQALNGNLVFNFKEGSIANSEIAQRIARVITFFKGNAEPSASPAETRFTRLTGTASITNGVMANNNLALVSPQILAKGQGKVNIPQSRVDYTLNVALNDEGKPRANRYVPIEIGGSFSDLDYDLALTGVIKDKAEEAVKKEVKEKEQELKEELQQKLGDELEDLRGRFNF